MNQNFELKYTDTSGDEWIEMCPTREEAEQKIQHLLDDGMIASEEDCVITPLPELK